MNRLRNMRCYLGGAMEFAEGLGIDWREQLKQNYYNFGIVWLDPTNKPIDTGIEDIENHSRRKALKRCGDFYTVAEEMRVIRCVDLRMVDISDFLIFNIDIDTYTTGTTEEITTANRQKKPIITRIKQGKENTPDWLLGMIPHQMIFSNWISVHLYLDRKNKGEIFNWDRKRWYFFNFNLKEDK